MMKKMNHNVIKIMNLPEDSVVAAVSVEAEIVSLLSATVRALPVTSQMIQKATVSEPLLQKVILYYCTKWPRGCPD